MTDKIECPKCNYESGDSWAQCEGSCPMPMSPYYQDQTAEIDALHDRIEKLLSNLEQQIDGKEAAAAEERAKIVAWLRDSKSVMKIMEPWHSRKKDGTLTNKTRENIGVAYIAMKDAADAIEAKEHLK